MKSKKLIIFSILLVFILLFSSCKNNIPKYPENAPQYLKDVYNDIIENGIKVHYNPEALEEIPEPQKPYTFAMKRNIPDDWIIGELEWPMHKTPSMPYGVISFCGMYGDYLLEQVPKEEYTPPVSHPNAEKPILKLYRRKNPAKPLPKKLSKLDYVLVKVLDEAPENGTRPQNQDYTFSDRFVVWTASSNESCSDWQTWGYDIKKDKLFPICSYKDFKIPYRGDSSDKPFYVLMKGRGILIATLVSQDSNGKLSGKIIIYDLANEKVTKLISSEKYIYSSAAMVDNYLYVDRTKLYQDIKDRPSHTPYSIVRINLATDKEEVVIPDADFYISGAFHEKIGLIPLCPEYHFQDVWILNTKTNEMTCYMKIPIEENPLSSGIVLMENGFLVAAAQPGGREAHYFYRYSDGKIFCTGPTISRPDNLGRFTVMKTEYDLFYPPPPFDYPGKKKRMEGYNTFLIIKPK